MSAARPPAPAPLPPPPPRLLPEGAQLTMRVMPMPCDTNVNGDIFGGWIMAQVDLAGSVLAGRIAQGRIVTVAVNRFVFKQPVVVGDLLSFWGTVERIGRTSVTVQVEVHAERNPAAPHTVKVTDASLTYVAIDEQGQPRPVGVKSAPDLGESHFGDSTSVESRSGAEPPG